MFTNAQHNRKQAIRLFEAGFTPAEIAAEFPLAFRLVSENGKPALAQVYSKAATEALHTRDHIAAECGLRESNLMISSRHVSGLIESRATA